MKYYYLINGKIMSHTKPVPTKEPLIYTLEQWVDNWKKSLQPCEISEDELEKVNNCDYNSYYTYGESKTIIEVTDIVEEKELRTETKSGSLTDYKLVFKQPSDNNGVITFKEKDAECEHDCNTKSLTCLCPYICKRNRVDEEIDLELIVRRENGNDLEMATKIVQEILKQFSVAKKTTSIDC